MPRNDEGEFELVLGNRQLLSGFFIVVILFAIFFSMGYVVGRNSTPAPMDTTASAAAPESAALATAVPQRPAARPGRSGHRSEKPAAAALPDPSPQPVGTRPATAPPETPRAGRKSRAPPCEFREPPNPRREATGRSPRQNVRLPTSLSSSQEQGLRSRAAPGTE